jgi:hypothetical protein
VVDGGGLLHRALIGDAIAELAIQNGWAGVVINGAIRDSVIIGSMRIGLKALGTNPRESIKFCGVLRLHGWGLGVICDHGRGPERLSQSAIQGPGAGLQEQVGASLGPLHLLLGDGSELAWAFRRLNG